MCERGLLELRNNTRCPLPVLSAPARRGGMIRAWKIDSTEFTRKKQKNFGLFCVFFERGTADFGRVSRAGRTITIVTPARAEHAHHVRRGAGAQRALTARRCDKVHRNRENPADFAPFCWR